MAKTNSLLGAQKSHQGYVCIFKGFPTNGQITTYMLVVASGWWVFTVTFFLYFCMYL